MKWFKLFWNDLLGIGKYLKNINRKTFFYFFKEPIVMRRIILRLKGSFYIQDNNLLLSLPNNIVLNVKNAGMLDVISELFWGEIYDFDAAGEYIVMDIGMNIGCASLFLASMPEVKKIYAFEPFKPTFDNACDNFKLNENISKKINPFNFGISDKDETLDIAFSVEDSAVMTTKVSDAGKNNKNAKKETVSVKDINYVFHDIIKEKDARIVFKIDCEGSEYEIFEAMDKNGLFKNIDIMMIEWHCKGKEPLLEIFRKNGFFSFMRRMSDSSGLIYSIRVNK